MTDTNPTISLIILNLHGLNILIIRQILSEWIKKQDLPTFCLQKIHYKYKDTYKLK